MTSPTPTLTDEQIKDRCAEAGIRWIEPDGEPDGFPGSFDMVTMDEMRKLLAALPTGRTHITWNKQGIRLVNGIPETLPTGGAGEVPVGWKLVPVEPTSEMQTRALYANERGDIRLNEVLAIYKTMLAASPAPSQGEAGEVSSGHDLNPKTALIYARQMKAYCEAFNDRDWASISLYGSVDEKNLATALDNLTECAAMLMNMASRVASPASSTGGVGSDRASWPAGLLERVKAAEQRIADNHAPRRIPADPHGGDVDLVLAEVRYLIEGRWPPFWIKPADESGVNPSAGGER